MWEDIFIYRSLGFDAAFSTSIPLTREYGEIQVFLDTQQRKLNQSTGKIGKQIMNNLNLVVTLESKQLDLLLCGFDNYNYPNKEEMKFKEVDTYQCIKDKSQMIIGGTFQSTVFQYLRVFLVPCQNSSAAVYSDGTKLTCKSVEDQRKYFNSVDFRIRYVYTYFDSEDFNQPIKAYLEDKLFLPLQYGVKKGVEIHLKKNHVALNDNILPFQSSKDLTFISTETQIFFQADINRKGLSFAHINLRLDRRQDLFTRNVYSISQLLSDIGGIYNTLFLIGFILASQFSEKIFYAKAIKEIFQTYDMKQKSTQKSQDSQESQGQKKISINIGKLSKSVTATSLIQMKQDTD
eukprot:403375291